MRIHTLMCIAGGTTNTRVTFEGNSWLLRRVFFPYEGAVRDTPLEEMGARDGRVGVMVRGRERLRVGDTRYNLTML